MGELTPGLTQSEGFHDVPCCPLPSGHWTAFPIQSDRSSHKRVQQRDIMSDYRLQRIIVFKRYQDMEPATRRHDQSHVFRVFLDQDQGI